MENKKYISVSQKLKMFRPGTMKTVEHYPTGIGKLDKMLGGGLYAGLIFLGARPGMGKSTLALQIASEIAAEGTAVLFYSLEMPAIRMESKILNRAIHMEKENSSITSDWLLRTENADKKEEWKFIEQVQGKLGNRYDSLYIKERDRISFSAEDVIQDVEEFMNITDKKPVVFVDYLQILSACASSRNLADKQRADENINALSSLSNKYDLAIFVISSLNRESYKNAQKPLQMDSFKETGGIEYSASVILGLQPRNISNENYDHEEEMSRNVRELELVFLKQRYGVTGQGASVPLDFYAAYDLYLEKTEETMDSPKEDEYVPEKTSPQLDLSDDYNRHLYEKFMKLKGQNNNN